MLILFEESKKIAKKYPELSKKYIKWIMEYAKKYKVRIPEEIKYKFCRKCYILWTEKNLKREREKEFVKYTCKICGYTRRRKE